ncbi:hypothetical protein CHS0354_018279 [Potamilus streckersoni]|uniref:Mitochondria-eating protein C-terminal domain-containing protein n=1 Tax=Potamilus streckersoni TaxID=2493646 RepID=A0AAE0RQJ0_9BIVA|nr:hypothetical protein CHS0354_018279 [Potamilus streckersoni]
MDEDCSKDQNNDKATVKHLHATLTIDQEKQIKTIWRTTTDEFKDEAVTHLHKVLSNEFGISSKDYPDTSKYLASCIDFCWKMGVQEKPMHLDTLAEKEDGLERIFVQDKFKAYTKSGKRVAYLVWPALFVHEGGAMLAKGIAQGCKEIENLNDSVHA